MEDTEISVVKGTYLSKAGKVQSVLWVRNVVCRYKDVCMYVCVCVFCLSGQKDIGMDWGQRVLIYKSR